MYQPAIKPLVIDKIKLTKLFLIIFLVLLVSVKSQGQKITKKRKQLEKERTQLLQKIDQTKKVMAQTKEQESHKLTQLKAINTQIKTREKVINNIGQEIFEITVEVEESKNTIDTLLAQLKVLKAEYAKNMVMVYKNKNNLNSLTYVFNAEGFNDGYKRIKYLEKLSEYKQMQARLIVNIQKSMEQEVNKMLVVKKQSEQLYSIKENEKKELEVDKKTETQVLTQLQQKQKQLQDELKESEKNYQKLTQKIADLIQKEIELARQREENRRREIEAREERERAKLIAENKRKGIETKPAATKKVPVTALSPEDFKTNTDFEQMKNRLPWPVNNGFISMGFGTHQHPTLKQVKTTNNGVNINCNPQSSVKCVFKGKVKAIFPVPGMENVILVKHGEYFTVYAKLVNVSVKIGQEISAGENIGSVYTNESENKTELHFEIFKGKQAQDPERWLRN